MTKYLNNDNILHYNIDEFKNINQFGGLLNIYKIYIKYKNKY